MLTEKEVYAVPKGSRENGYTEISCVIKQLFTLSTVQQFI
jgi:hypothetical protein